MQLETIIGLEIHVQLSTKSKLFSQADNDAFGAPPNSRVTPICMGFPGMLPVLNKSALDKAVRGAAALGGQIQKYSKFDRKNYFYPDLPNGYQISQFDEPVSLGGALEIFVNGEYKTINMTRLHLEIDAGKLTHTGENTLCDYNRSGTPLAEIVTEPDLRSAEEAVALAKEIQRIMRFVASSDADMEKGMMRFDASVSLRPVGDKKLYPRAEIKNLNSFSSLGKAIKYEIARQKQLWIANNPQSEEVTVGWLDDLQKTKLLRSKESAMDYRYFPEPDLPPITFTDQQIQTIYDDLPELPLAKFKRYQSDFGLSLEQATKLSETPELAHFFEKAASHSNPKKSANLILKHVLAETYWDKTEITPEHVSDVVNLLEQSVISSSGGDEILKHLMEHGGNAKKVMDEKGLEQKSDSGEIETWVDTVLAENPQSIADYKAGKEKALQYLMGQVMKASRGAANPPMVMKILKEKI